MSELTLKQMQKEWLGSLQAYLIGFLISLLLTLVSFGLVGWRLFHNPLLALLIVALALIQATIQLLFFLHVGQEAKPRWETAVFFFMLLVLFIIAFGSLWIMYDLGDRVMTHMETSHD